MFTTEICLHHWQITNNFQWVSVTRGCLYCVNSHFAHNIGPRLQFPLLLIRGGYFRSFSVMFSKKRNRQIASGIQHQNIQEENPYVFFAAFSAFWLLERGDKL